MIFWTRVAAYVAALAGGAGIRLATGPEFQLSILPAALALGAALAVAGGLLWRTRGPVPSGIPLAPPWVIVTWDGIALVAALMAGGFLADGLGLGGRPLIVDEAATFALSIMTPVGVLVLAGFVHSYATRGVLVDAQGIALSGEDVMRWEDMDALTCEQEYLPAGRVGVVVPNRFRRVVVATGRDGRELRLPEPQTRRLQARLMARLRAEAPARLQADVEGLGLP